MKKIIVFITVLCIILTSILGTVYAQAVSSKPPLSMQILGKKITTDAPIIKDEIMYLPFRAVAENLGFKVNWYSRLKRMDIVKDDNNSSVTVDNKYAYVNKKRITLDYMPIMNNGKVYVPYSFIESNFEFTLSFNESNNVVTISEKIISNEDDVGTMESNIDSKPIFINDKRIQDDYTAIIKDGKTYIPVRAVGEGLGYAVNWYSDINKIELTKDKDIISVIVNSKTAYINGNKVNLDANSFLQSGRAYASISFLQDILNCTVTVDDSKGIVNIKEKKDLESGETKEENKNVIASITDIVYDESYGFSNIKIIADNEIKYTTFTLNNPERFVIDIQNAVVRTSFQNKSINKGGISRVRIAQNSIVPDKVVRIVIDLESAKECKLVQGLDKSTLSVMYANIIKPITVTKEGNKDVVTIAGNNNINISDMKLLDPERIVLDIKGAVLETAEQTIEVDSPLLKTIRTGQFEEGTARVVLDLNTTAFYSIKKEGNTVKVYVSDISFDFFQYKKLYNTSYLDLKLESNVEYQVSIDNVNNLLKIIIPKELDVEPNKYQLNDNIIEYVEINKQKVKNNHQTVVICKMKPLVNYELLTPALTSQIGVKFKYNAQKFEDLTIAIDAGHGGKDPGAIGSDGTMEKDLNMDVAKRLNEKLKAIGFKTIMTRTDDTYIDLGTRTNIANNNYADFFMSVHFNSFNSTSKGIETLYFPNSITEECSVLNRQVADIFHKELVNALQMPSRGVTPRPNLYVLNKTKMPSILAELGFISNPDELAKMKTEEYRDMAAKALAVSIVKYFSDVQKIDFGFDVQSIYNDTTPKVVLN